MLHRDTLFIKTLQGFFVDGEKKLVDQEGRLGMTLLELVGVARMDTEQSSSLKS